MPDDSYPSDKAERIMVRLPDGMRDRLAFAAHQNRRSTNAEVVARLEASFDSADYVPTAKEQEEARQAFLRGFQMAAAQIGEATAARLGPDAKTGELMSGLFFGTEAEKAKAGRRLRRRMQAEPSAPATGPAGATDEAIAKDRVKLQRKRS